MLELLEEGAMSLWLEKSKAVAALRLVWRQERLQDPGRWDAQY